MSAAGQLNGTAKSNLGGPASKPDMLCAKPFTPKGPGKPLLPNLNSDILRQKLAAMNSKTAVSDSLKPDSPKNKQKNVFNRGNMSLKSPVCPPVKPPRTSNDRAEVNDVPQSKTRSGSAPADPDLSTRGSVKDALSRFEASGKPPIQARKKPSPPSSFKIGDKISALSNSAVPLVASKPAPQRPLKPVKSLKPVIENNNNTKPPDVNPVPDAEPVKPTNVQLPVYPAELDKWIRQYVITNAMIKPLASIEKWNIVKSEASSSHTSLNSISSHGTTEEIYDDLNMGDAIYDDAGNITSKNGMDSLNPTYDGKEEASTPALEMEKRAPPDGVQQEGDALNDDTVDSQMLYEPIETIQTMMPPTKPQEEEAVKDKKKDDKDRKEKDKKERKERERQEKEKKRVEEEKKRKEREEKKRKAKERKMFGLKPDEELNVIERHFAQKDYKGKDKELTYAANDCVEVISKENCPKGKWLARNPFQKLGYILLSEFSIKANELENDECTGSPGLPLRIPTEDELEEQGELYDSINTPETGNLAPPELPPDRNRSPRPPIDEQIYNDVDETHDDMEEDENLYQAI